MAPTSTSSAPVAVPPLSASAAPAAGGVLVTHDAPAAAPGGTSPGAAFMSQLPLLVAIVAIFYFLIIRPQNQERKRHEALLAGLKKDDRVVTSSGLIGKISQVRDSRVELELAPKVRVWIEKVAVKSLEAEPAAADASKEG